MTLTQYATMKRVNLLETDNTLVCGKRFKSDKDIYMHTEFIQNFI